MTVGTIFERTQLPLRIWFAAMWFVSSQKDGASALGLKRVLYQTVWTWLHKLRQAMVRPDRDKLCGHVEVDETYVGGSETGGKRGRGSERVVLSGTGDPAHVSMPGVHRIAALIKR